MTTERKSFFKRLKINKFRNIAPNTELFFNEHFNVLLGENATGKTTLLNLVGNCLECFGTGLSQYNEDLDVEYEIECPSATIEVKIVFSKSQIENDRFINDSKLYPLTRPAFFAKFIRHDNSETYVIEQTDSTLKLSKNNKLILETSSFQTATALPMLIVRAAKGLGQVQDLADMGYLVSIVDEMVNDFQNVVRFDESLDTFNQLTDKNRVFAPSVTLDSKKALLSTRFIPKEIEASITTASHPTDKLVFASDDIPFLNAIVKLLGFQTAEIEIEFHGENMDGETKNTKFKGINFLFSRKNKKFTHNYLSYGQKRLLSFFYYVALNPRIIIADELVNGLHHTWIKECMATISDRQSILTSQNPLLLDYLEFESVDQVQNSLICCRIEERDGVDVLVWENMKQDDAAMVYSAYQAEIEHVGEILRTRNLW